MTEVFFENIEKEISKRLIAANNHISIAVAWFTNETLFFNLLECLKKGVSVDLIIMDDYINRNEFALDYSIFIMGGGNLFFPLGKKMHNKFCIIDNTILTGSYNWTFYAETYNTENIVISDDFNFVQCYKNEFEKLLSISKRTTKYAPLKLDTISKSELYNNYNYLCNDLILKGEQYKDYILSFNKKLNIDIKIEKKDDTKYDNRGIPILRKCLKDIHTVRRLVYFSLERIPLGRPNSGRKYVHAKYISNNIWVIDNWVDIFDPEYVSLVAQYFHKKDGGILDDKIVLPPIPEEVYNPMMKFHFKQVCYIFYKFGKYGDARKKIGEKGQILQKNGSPYLFNMFHTLIRFDKNPNEYIGFNSMTELCHLIVESLFVPNIPDDNDIITDYSCLNGTYKASIDDFRSICCEIEEGNVSEETKTLMKKKLNTNPEGIWLQKKEGQSVACAYGFYTNTSIYSNNMIAVKNGLWYVLIRLKASSINYESDKFRELFDGIINNLKLEGKKGIIYICPIQSVGYFEKLGFKREYSSEVSGADCVMRLVFV